jgi:Arc/MetJ-type ribon-helix-helix transcriptional regulator
MDTLTIKIPEDLAAAIEKAVRRTHLTKSELVRRALVAYTARQTGGQFVSALEQAGDLVGCFKGGPRDLASNPRHMEGFGKK